MKMAEIFSSGGISMIQNAQSGPIFAKNAFSEDKSREGTLQEKRLWKFDR